MIVRRLLSARVASTNTGYPPTIRVSVPDPPTIHANQVDYFFPGLEDAENVQTIVQPVLGWNAFNDQGWTIASWNCCLNGETWNSAPVAVAAGATVEGSVRGSSCHGGVCDNWTIVTSDPANDHDTTLNTSSYGQTFDWVFGAVLASIEERRSTSPERARAIVLAVAAALALGLFVYFLGLGSRDGDALSTLFGARIGSLAVLIVLVFGPVAVADPTGADPLLTRMCTPPNCCAASATMRSTCSLLVTSAAIGTMRRFVSAPSSRAVASRSALFRATIATSTPSRANSRAMALPMPRLPPVTIACLPCNPRSMALSLLGGLTAIYGFTDDCSL